MEVFEQYSLINESRWTEFLQGLEVRKGPHKFTFPSIEAIHSFKSVAYKLNTDRLGRLYSIRADKKNKIVEITVKMA